MCILERILFPRAAMRLRVRASRAEAPDACVRGAWLRVGAEPLPGASCPLAHRVSRLCAVRLVARRDRFGARDRGGAAHGQPRRRTTSLAGRGARPASSPQAQGAPCYANADLVNSMLRLRALAGSLRAAVIMLLGPAQCAPLLPRSPLAVSTTSPHAQHVSTVSSAMLSGGTWSFGGPRTDVWTTRRLPASLYGQPRMEPM